MGKAKNELAYIQDVIFEQGWHRWPTTAQDIVGMSSAVKTLRLENALLQKKLVHYQNALGTMHDMALAMVPSQHITKFYIEVGKANFDGAAE